MRNYKNVIETTIPGYEKYLAKHIYLLFIMVVLIIVYAINCQLYGSIDGITLYFLKAAPFPTTVLMDGDRDQALVMAGYNMLDVCVTPSFLTYMVLHNTDPSALNGKTKAIADRAVFEAVYSSNKLAVVQSKIDSAYAANVASVSVAYNSDSLSVSLSGVDFHPLCTCIDKVATKYRDNKTKTLSDAVAAVNACASTQMHVRQEVPYTFVTDDNYPGLLSARKSVSRYSFIFNLAMAIMINVAYSCINYTDCNTAWDVFSNNIIQYIFLFIAIMSTIFVCYSTQAYVAPLNVFMFTVYWFFPKLFIGIITEIYLTIYPEKSKEGRAEAMHPMTFYMTLSTLYLIALLENGVFTFHVMINYIVSSFGISLVYCALLFLDRGKQMASESLVVPYLLMLLSTAILVIWNLLPTFSMACEWSIMWLLPGCFCCFCFVNVVFSDKMKSEKAQTIMHVFHFLVLLVVVVYYVRDLQSFEYQF